MGNQTRQLYPDVIKEIRRLSETPCPPIWDFNQKGEGVKFSTNLDMGDSFSLINMHLKSVLNIQIMAANWDFKLQADRKRGITYKYEVKIYELG